MEPRLYSDTVGRRGKVSSQGVHSLRKISNGAGVPERYMFQETPNMHVDLDDILILAEPDGPRPLLASYRRALKSQFFSWSSASKGRIINLCNKVRSQALYPC